MFDSTNVNSPFTKTREKFKKIVFSFKIFVNMGNNEPFWTKESQQILSELHSDLSGHSAPIKIYEPVKSGVKYIVGVKIVGDYIASVVFKTNDPSDDPKCPSYSVVAYLHEKIEVFKREFALFTGLVRMYNVFDGVKIMHEATAATQNHISNLLAAEKLDNLLMVFRSDIKGKVGFYLTTDVDEWINRQANIYISKFGDRLRSLELVHALLWVGTKPYSDSLSGAFFMALVGLGSKIQSIK